MSQIDQMLQGLAASAGLSDAIQFNEQGVATLSVAGKLELHLEKVNDGRALQLYCAIGPLPSVQLEGLLLDAMQANLFTAQTKGSVLSIDAQSNELLLSQLVHPEAVSNQQFLELLDDFIDVAEIWHDKLTAKRWLLPVTSSAAPKAAEQELIQAQFMHRV